MATTTPIETVQNHIKAVVMLSLRSLSYLKVRQAKWEEKKSYPLENKQTLCSWLPFHGASLHKCHNPDSVEDKEKESNVNPTQFNTSNFCISG